MFRYAHDFLDVVNRNFGALIDMRFKVCIHVGFCIVERIKFMSVIPSSTIANYGIKHCASLSVFIPDFYTFELKTCPVYGIVPRVCNVSHDYCFLFADFDCPVLAVFVDGYAVFHLVIPLSSILRRIVGACSQNPLRGRMLIQ